MALDPRLTNWDFIQRLPIFNPQDVITDWETGQLTREDTISYATSHLLRMALTPMSIWWDKRLLNGTF